MTTDMQKTEAVEAVAADAPYHLIALDRPQLEEAQVKMLAWAEARRDKVDVDVDVEETNLTIAQTNGWLTAPFERRLNVLAKQRVFYSKILDALRAGYAIVPNFQMDVFAIRTKAKTPRGQAQTSQWSRGRFDQAAQILPAGQGRYTSPLPSVHAEPDVRTNADGSKTNVVLSWPEEFNEVGFPVALARPELMSRTAQAMALRLFDEIGVARDTTTTAARSRHVRGDPIILGRIINPRLMRPSLTFFLGWYFDPSRL